MEDIFDLEEFELPEISLPPSVADPDIIRRAIINALTQEPVYTKQQRDYNGRTYKPSEILWVSELLFCPLKKAYEIIAGEPPREREELMKERLKTRIGSLLHNEIAKRISAGGNSEVCLMKDYRGEYLLIGKVDYLMPNTLLEFKTTFWSFRDLNEVPEYYEDQAQLYMWLADREVAYLVVISLRDKDVRVFDVRRNNQRIEFLLDRGLKIVNALRTMNLDGVEYDNTHSFICQTCWCYKCPVVPVRATTSR